MGIGVKYRFARGLWRWGRLADFWPRSGRYEADCPQRHSPYPYGSKPQSEHDFLAQGAVLTCAQRTLIPRASGLTECHGGLTPISSRLRFPLRARTPAHAQGQCDRGTAAAQVAACGKRLRWVSRGLRGCARERGRVRAILAWLMGSGQGGLAGRLQ